MNASAPPPLDDQGTSTRPYLVRALHEWCTDNGFTPYLAVFVSPQVQVPPEYVKNHEIVLNVGFEATSGLELGNEWISFKARFGGVPRDIVVPVDHVVAIYARENGQGMAFPMPQAGAAPEGLRTQAPAAGGGERRRGADRGLRLASTDGEAADATPAPTPAPTPAAVPTPGSRVRPARTSAPAVGPAPADDAPPAPKAAPTPAAEQPQEPPPAGPRPALKRVK